MLWQEVVRIMKFGPSKRPAAETLYHKSTSQPSESNLNEATSASHNLSKGNRDADGSSTYFSRFADGNGNMEAVGANHHQENNRPRHQQAAFDQFRANTNNMNQGIYDKTPLGTIDASDSV